MNDFLQFVGFMALLGLVGLAFITGVTAWVNHSEIDKLKKIADEIKPTVRELVDAEMKIVREEMRVAMGPLVNQMSIGGILEDQAELERRVEKMEAGGDVSQIVRSQIEMLGLVTNDAVVKRLENRVQALEGYREVELQKMTAVFNQIRGLGGNIDNLSADIAVLQTHLGPIATEPSDAQG